MAFVRQRFWIVGGMSLAIKVFRSCVRCTRAKPVVFRQVMGDLPSDRMVFSRPFVVTGVDLFGPFVVMQKGRGSNRIKAYVALFICFGTKAIHLEMVEDLSTAAFINSLIRFTSRRGIPQTLWADNATNFRGADELLKNIDWTQVDSWCRTARQITWKFIPPRSPHFGGLWESGVKIAKSALLKVVGETPVHRDEFETLLTLVEATLNSRPLIPVTMNPNDGCPFTPGHFLIHQPLNELPAPVLVKPNPQHNDMIRRWKHINQLRQYWVEKFGSLLLSTLQIRYKWNSSSPDIKLNTAVLMVDRNLSSWKWSLARISKLFPGKDGRVRVVEVTTPTGSTFRRAIKELVPIRD